MRGSQRGSKLASKHGAQRGMALAAAVVVLFVCTALGLVLFHTARSRAGEVQGRLDDRRADALADAALSEAITAVNAGFSGNIGTMAAPARLGDGVFWVAADDPGGGATRLRATALLGSGRASLTAFVAGEDEEPLFQAVLNSKEELPLSEGVVIDSYDSQVGTYAAQATQTYGGYTYAKADGDVTSNAGILLSANVHVFGDATPGPGHTVSFSTGSYVAGSVLPAPEPFTFPEVVYPGFPAAGAYSVPTGGSKSLGPGNYGFTDLSIEKDGVLTIQGPATIEVQNFVGGKNADLMINATGGPVTIFVTNTYTHTSGFEADAVSGSPMALAFMIGGTTPIVFPNLTKVRGGYYAPNANITFSNDNEAWGAFAGNKISMSNTMKFHYDESLSKYWGGDGSGLDAVEVFARYPASVEPATLLADRRDPVVVLGVDKDDLLSPADAWWNP